MEVGINMGRRSPWSKDDYKQLYEKLDAYCNIASLMALKNQGINGSSETFAAYTMFKYPVVYLFVHYHFGNFEDVGMSEDEISNYIMSSVMITEIAQGLIDGMEEGEVFPYDPKKSIAPLLKSMCEEVLYIENNF
ncbi:MAG: hypothetical protein KBT28_05675 [Bacteroidales bacterium]|nr:hypothetical protein [Candidatus Colimorpha merdihippi]